MVAFGELLCALIKPALGAAGRAPSYALTRTASAPPRQAAALMRGPPPALLVLARGCRSADPGDHPTMEQV